MRDKQLRHTQDAAVMVVAWVKFVRKPPELRRAFRNSASAERHAARDLRGCCPHLRLSCRLPSPSRYDALRSALGRHAHPNTCAGLFRGCQAAKSALQAAARLRG